MAVAEFAGRACDDDDASFSFSSPPEVRNRARVCYATFTSKEGLDQTTYPTAYSLTNVTLTTK